MRRSPGVVRDLIIDYLTASGGASIAEITKAVENKIGPVANSSIRSYLNLNTPRLFERQGTGRYRLQGAAVVKSTRLPRRIRVIGTATLVEADAFEWLSDQSPSSVEAIVTDPPYGLVEYTDGEQFKLRAKTGGGVWRVPPSFDGHKRAPLPRFTVLNDGDRAAIYDFFHEFGRLALRVTVPGANVVVASNPLLAHVVASAMSDAGLEYRGSIIRNVMTMRGGDRPKNAHEEFDGVSVMPRSMHEPWVTLRHPLDGRAQDNLRRWRTGGFRRPSDERPFGDLIKSGPTPAREKRIAPHPSLKPQGFMRQLVWAALPLGEGVVLDPFAGAGSTLAAASAVGYTSIGVERDKEYFELASKVIGPLGKLDIAAVEPVRA